MHLAGPLPSPKRKKLTTSQATNETYKATTITPCRPCSVQHNEKKKNIKIPSCIYPSIRGMVFFFAALQNSIEYTASHPSCTGVQGAKDKRTNWRFGKKPTDVRSQEEGSMVSSEFHCMHKGRRTQYSVGTTWRVREKNRDRGCTICGQERRKFTKCNAVSLTFHRGFHSSCEWLSVRGWWLVPIFFFCFFLYSMIFFFFAFIGGSVWDDLLCGGLIVNERCLQPASQPGRQLVMYVWEVWDRPVL